MRTFRDSVNPDAIPLDGISGAIGYANGRFRWTAAETERFTAAGLQTAMVDVDGTAFELASILDVERGDAGPAQAPDWIRKRNAFRGDATVYCDLSTLPAVLAATSRVTGSWWLWLAHYTGHPHIPEVSLPAGVKIMGCQYLSTENYDESCITADGWHRA
jgi:hypothetical protein